MMDYNIEEIEELVLNYVPKELAADDDLMETIYDNISYYGAYDVQRGAFKMAIIPQFEDWVIKLPFNGEIDYDGDFTPFPEEEKVDCCLLELSFFNRMKKLGFDCFFADTKFVGTINKTPTYVQEKVRVYASLREEERKYKDKNLGSFCDLYRWLENSTNYCDTDFYEVDEENNTLFNLPSIWWRKAVDIYGVDKVKNFMLFILTEDPDIDFIFCDLHCCNFGFRKIDGTPCILDFTGYSEKMQ